MRWLVPLALAAALAGCSVNTEGAACPTPGTSDGCPGGQRCGAGGTCSVAAMGCQVCTPDALACRDGDVKRCSAAADPVCGTWIVATACAAGTTTCGVPLAGGSPECRCERFVADPAGAAASTTCRFATVAEAIVEAGRFGVSEVRLGGAVGQDYGGDASLTVPDGVTVVADDTPLAPASRVLEIGGTGQAAVQLGVGASLAGVTVRRKAGGPATGVEVTGASPTGRASLTEVVLDAAGAGGAFPRGVLLGGSGSVSLVDVSVRGTSAVGVEVVRSAVDDQVTAIDLVVDGEATAAAPAGQGTGISLTTGDLTLTRPVIKRCGGVGLLAGFGGGRARLAVAAGKVHDNYGTGVAAQFIEGFSVTGADVCKNKGGAPRNVDGVNRTIGGAFFGGTAPSTQAFVGLRVFDNDGDQLGIGPGTSTWNLQGPTGTGAACGTGVNAFAGYLAGSYGLVTAGNVDVSWNAWPNGAPVIGVDVLRIKTPTVVLGTEPPNSNYCSLPPDLTCPAP